MKSGKKNVIHIGHTSALWIASWKRYKAGSTSAMPGEDDFSYEFKSALALLKKTCSSSTPAEKGRLLGTGVKLTMTSCDREAQRLVG